MSINPSRIDMDDFLELLGDQLGEGDNGDIYIDYQGIRAIGQTTVEERDELCLFPEEKRVLSRWQKDSQLRFPATIGDVQEWIERTERVEMTERIKQVIAQRAADKRGRPAKITTEHMEYARDLVANGKTKTNAGLLTAEHFELPASLAGSITDYLKPSRQR